MCRENPHYSQIENNLICLAIPWREDDAQLEKWKTGQTGYPFIDAGMRQLLQEGWMHHTVRNAVALFLTRGDLWINWEKGHQHFMDHLVDADLAVSAGNWMWVSSSAFDCLLDGSLLIDPVDFGRHLEPSGDYIRRYVPELTNFDFEFIHEPWKAPIQVQQASNCIIGKTYHFFLLPNYN
jgi:cryptochrome